MAHTLKASNDAVMDLSKWDPAEKNILRLDSEWEFYWNRLLSPDDFKQSSHTPLLVTPSSWNDLEIDGQKTGSYGYATYRLTLIHPPPTDLLLDAYSIQTSSRIIINGIVAAEAGQPGISSETTRPMNRDIQVKIPANTDTIEIIVQVANFHHRKGGFVHPFELGTAEAIGKQRLLYYILDFIESSALAIIGLFLFALYIFRRKDLSVLYFALFCITLSFRPITAVNYTLASLFPGISWDILLKIEYLAVLFPCLFMLTFIKKLFPAQLPDLIVKLLGVVLLIKIAITVVFPPSVFSWLVLPLLFVITFGVLIFIITIIRAMLAKVEGANYAGVGLLILLASLLLKVMVYAGIISPVYVLITALDIGFIFMMSLILGARFSIQFVKVETLQKKAEVLHQVIEKEKEQVEKQKELVEEKNKEILDSITYAKRIQTAILPPRQQIRKHLPESFIFYKPKDIVAGDFYWMETIQRKDKNILLFAVADCTGHGVPGAMISVVCHNALNRAVREFSLERPDEILNKTRELVIEQFVKSEDDVKDGMDIGLCALDPQTLELQFAGAHNSLYIIHEGELIEVKADRQPVGKYANSKEFTNNHIQLSKGDCIYLFSDGFADQFGGPKGKKFTHSGIKKLLSGLYTKDMSEQGSEIERTFDNWKGELEQLDDVLVMGIRI